MHLDIHVPPVVHGVLIARIDRPHFGAIGALVDLDLDERQQLLRFFNRTRACDLDDVDGRVATAAPLDLDVPGDVGDFELAIVAELYGLGELFGLLFAAVAVVDADAGPRPLALLIDDPCDGAYPHIVLSLRRGRRREADGHCPEEDRNCNSHHSLFMTYSRR